MRNIQLKAEKKFGKYQAGQEFLANKVEAKALVALGRASYLTTAIQSAPVTKTANPDGLDALDSDALHALAKELEVEVHHRAGPDKVRAAIRASFN